MEATDFYYELYSKNYYDFLHDFSKTDYESDKLLGRFYTDYFVSDEMASRVVKESADIIKKNAISIIDPFCGDGRLIISIVSELNKVGYCGKITVFLWDVDDDAVKKATENLNKYAKECKANLTIKSRATDSFVYFADYESEFDICVTNPPWGLLKPLKLFNSRCTDEELGEYKSSIASYDEYMKGEFSISMPTSKFGRWGTNLGRCGVEVALRLISSEGVCGVVSPASLFNDQVSQPFRKWMFEDYNISSISYYPAELKLYGSADVSSITVVYKKGSTKKTDILLYDESLKHKKRKLNSSDIKEIAQKGYTIPLESALFKKGITIDLKNCIPLEEYCERNGLRFVREMDETRVSEKLTTTGNIVFAKGYMVDRYSFSSEEKYLDESKLAPPDTVNTYKVVWRDVSRNSQKRRMKATMLNKGCIVGNSLGCISSKDDNMDVLAFLLAVMNSYVFEYQAREKLVSNHVPVGVIRKVMIPNTRPSKELIKCVQRALKKAENNCSTLEVMVAKLYGLSKNEYMDMLSGFVIDEKEKKELVDIWECEQ